MKPILYEVGATKTIWESSINDATRVITFIDSMSCQQCETGHDIEIAGVVAVMAEELVTAQLPHELRAGVGRAAC